MGLLLSTFRHEPYYATYEKRFEKLDQECSKLQVQKENIHRIISSIKGYYFLVSAAATSLAAIHAGWVYQQPPGTFAWDEHLLRTSPVIVLPLLLWLGYETLMAFFKWKSSVRQARLQRLKERKRKLIKEVKDMTRFDKVREFLQKWDPDVPPPQPIAPAGGFAAASVGQQQQQQQRGAGGNSELLSRLGGAASVAVGAAAGAGMSLLPLLDKVAQNVVGDSPTLVQDLRRLHQQVHAAEERARHLALENSALKQHNEAMRLQLLQLDAPIPELPAPAAVGPSPNTPHTDPPTAPSSPQPPAPSSLHPHRSHTRRHTGGDEGHSGTAGSATGEGAASPDGPAAATSAGSASAHASPARGAAEQQQQAAQRHTASHAPPAGVSQTCSRQVQQQPADDVQEALSTQAAAS